jgi:hypothetical protein
MKTVAELIENIINDCEKIYNSLIRLDALTTTMFSLEKHYVMNKVNSDILNDYNANYFNEMELYDYILFELHCRFKRETIKIKLGKNKRIDFCLKDNTKSLKQKTNDLSEQLKQAIEIAKEIKKQQFSRIDTETNHNFEKVMKQLRELMLVLNNTTFFEKKEGDFDWE